MKQMSQKRADQKLAKELKKERKQANKAQEEGFSIEDMVMDQYRNGNDVWEIASNMGMSEDEVQDIINDSEQGVSEEVESLQEEKGLVQDRKTGEWYDPKAAFDAMMNEPEIQAVFKRLAVR